MTETGRDYATVDSSCVHQWEPVLAYSGRYRCALCQCLGYRGIVTANREDGAASDRQVAWQSNTVKRAVTIFPYICQKKDCRKPAIYKGKRQFCKEHST